MMMTCLGRALWRGGRRGPAHLLLLLLRYATLPVRQGQP